METKQLRQTNMELLRILAMIMIISLHYLSKGGLLKALPREFLMSDYICWLLKAFCIIAVNVYVLISGYFMLETTFKWKKIFRIWFQVLFYSLGIPVVLLIAGVLNIKDITIYQMIQYGLPIFMEHYWFATCYIFLAILSPFLNSGIKAMNQKQHGSLLLGLIIIFSLAKTVLPIKLTYDHVGMDVLWFVCLYILAGYIRLYGFSYFNSLKKSLFTYILAVLGIFLWFIGLNQVVLQTGKFSERITMSYEYNHLLVLIASVSLFYVFHFMKNHSQKIGSWIVRIASGTFGVYLLHEHIEVRYLWTNWLGVNKSAEDGFSVLRFLITVGLVFVVGILVDWGRQFLFGLAEKMVVSIRRSKRNG